MTTKLFHLPFFLLVYGEENLDLRNLENSTELLTVNDDDFLPSSGLTGLKPMLSLHSGRFY